MQDFTNDPFVRSIRLERERVVSFDQYPFNIPAVKNLTELSLHPAVTFLVGENGSGKSTLLEAVAVALGFNPEGGSRNFTFATRPSHSELHSFLNVDRGRNLRKPRDGFFFRAESYFNLASNIEELDRLKLRDVPPLIQAYGGVSLHEQSHGESFFAFLNHRLGGDGLYVMDEPEAALSPSRQMSALAIIHRLVKAGSQLIIATHSPILMAYPHAAIYAFADDTIQSIKYRDTEHFRITSHFLNRTEKMLEILLADNDPQQGLF